MHFLSPVLWQFLVKWLHYFAVFPDEASSIAPYTDGLYAYLVSISIFGLLLVLAMVTAFSVRYRRARNPVASHIEGSTLLEATWTIIPLGLFMVSFVWGALLYFRIFTPPPNALPIYIIGKQWMWKAEHPGGQHEINALHVPMGKPVQLTMISQDVFHSFSMPAFRVKREVIPGRYTTVWFEATKTGTYHLFCSQYCGTLHSAMIGDIVVMSPDDYEAWANGNTSGMSLAQNGERLFASLGCNSCHTAGGGNRGPNLYGLYGEKQILYNGNAVTVDDAYLRGCILNPSAHAVQGYVPIMPTYQGQISEEGLIDLVEYIKSLKTGERIQQTLHTTTFAPDQKGATSPAPDYRSEQLIGQPSNGPAPANTSTSRGTGVSPQ